MKGEVVKYKIRLRETQAELNQVGPQSQTKQFAFEVKQIAFLKNVCINMMLKTEHRNGRENRNKPLYCKV